jgi:hypothetical protein
MRSSYIRLVGPVISLMLITSNVVARNGNSLSSQVAALQAAVTALQSTVTGQGSQSSQLQTQVGALKTSNDELRSRLPATVSGGQNIVEALNFGWAGGSYHSP